MESNNQVTPDIIKSNVLKLQNANATPQDIETYVKTASAEMGNTKVGQVDNIRNQQEQPSTLGNYTQNQASLLGQGQQEIGNIANNVASGKTGVGSGILQTGGVAARQTLGQIGLAAKTIAPQMVNDAFSWVGNLLGQGVSSLQSGIENNKTVQKIASSKVGDVVANTFENNPNLAPNLKAISDIANVATLKPAASIAKPAISKSLAITGDIAKTSAKQVGIGNVLENAARNLEQTNLRLTPLAKTKLAEQGSQVVDWLAKKGIVGNPEQRFAKIDSLYNQTESQVQSAIKDSGATYTKQHLVDLAKSIPETYATQFNNPEVYNQVVKLSGDFAKYIKTNFGENIPASKINDFKRAYAKNAFNKAGDQVTNEARLAVSDALYQNLLQDIPNLKSINSEYSNVISARKLIGKAMGKNELGLIGNLTSSAVGAGVGATLGGTIGAGVGAYVAPGIAKAIAGTKTRSAIGAGLSKLGQKINK